MMDELNNHPTEHVKIEAIEQPNKLAPPTHVVGIGASAGGLEALERLFENMPKQTGMAFVVVQHLSPDFKSVMDELLARKTRIPIFRVEDSMTVHADAIYLIPPRKDMIISNGKLLLTDKDPTQVISLPIDHFFRSLAHEAMDRSIGIVLSGTGSDGSRGIRDIHEAGGLVLVQNPETAKFDGMPNSAKQTGAVDLVLSPEDMPDALLKYGKHPLSVDGHLHLTEEPVLEEGLAAIFRQLRDAYGIDFSNYKLSTVNRRIERRILLNNALNLDDYVKRLSEDSDELNALYKDLLIGVTRFFRDERAFQKLSDDVLPKLLNEQPKEEDFRVWVAGCATGEEAYSLAILIHECMESLNKQLNVKIFASDVHRASLDYASMGLYTQEQLQDVSPQRLERYFIRRNDGYQIGHDLRQMVVFAPHNLIKDAPFTKINLVACRNLLIYFQPPAQRKAFSMFHFALKTGGVLFLGPSESPGELADEFVVVDPHWKIYRKRRDIRLPADLRLPLATTTTVRQPADTMRGRALGSASNDQYLFGTYDTLLDEYMPSSVLVNERREVVQTFSDANRFLRLRKGRLSTDILDMVDADLKTVLSGALQRVNLEETPVSYKGLRLQLPDGEKLINLTVKPFINKRSNVFHALIVLEEDPDLFATPVNQDMTVDMRKASHDQLNAMETELRYAKENLQSTIEEMETTNEELQATNEELVASNEELQSTNEELHSVNEELYTVNAEYQKKITELTELTADMDNLLESTQVHTLFLDRSLCIRKFTPRIAETFNLLPQDIGRKIDNFTHNIAHPGLLNDLHSVMETGEQLEKQVYDRHDQCYLLRILPYRVRDTIQGVVVTLIDLTNIKRAEAATLKIDQQMAGIMKNSPHLLTIKDREGRYVLSDDNFQRLAGTNPTGKTAHEIFPEETANALTQYDQEVLAEGGVRETEVNIPMPDGVHTFLAVKFPVRDQVGRIIAVGGVKTDVTRLKRAEHQAREAVEQRDRFLAMLSHELRNPLGAIVNAVTVLADQRSPADLKSNATDVLVRQSEQMTHLLDDLLEVSRITQNKMYMLQEVVRLDEVVMEAAHVVQPDVEKAELSLTIEKDSDRAYLMLGDNTRLQQMIINLLTNAIKYTPPQGKIWLKLTASSDKSEAVITVRDTGMGIRPELLNTIFDLFVQADNTLDRSSGGLGVGLTLVRNIAQLHHGTVTAKSDGVGRGSEFTVTLPINTELVMTEASKQSVNSFRGTGKIAIVEDNEASRRMLEAMLKLDGYEVYSANDGQSGFEMIVRQKPALALIDIGLPILNGYDLARRLKSLEEAKDIHLVALTGYGRIEDQRAAREAGFDEHLVKPLKRRELDKILQTTFPMKKDGVESN